MNDDSQFRTHSHSLPKKSPHSLESELAVLGGLMLDPEAWDKVGELITESDFFVKNHQLAFRAIAALADLDKPRDVLTVVDWLENAGVLHEMGGRDFVVSIVEETASAANVAAYANIVRERSILRQLIRVGQDIVESAYQPEGRDSKSLLDIAETKVFSIAEESAQNQSGFEALPKILGRTVEKIDFLFNNKSAITGIPTGFDDLDGKTSGFQRSDLIIVAGRPSMGKTTFSMNIAENVALYQDKPVAIFSMEMPGEQLAMRMIASLGRIELQKIRSGQLTDADWPRITSTISLLSNKSKLHIDATAGLTPNELRARSRRLAREHDGLSMIVVDYLQLMQGNGRSENRVNEVAEISRSLKALAKELNVPVVALSQLSRTLEQRPDKRPIMSDLRESGAIEQDADVIIFIYRDEVYNPESPEKGTAEILIRKQRNGPTGMVRLAFQGQFTRFDNYSGDLPEYDE